MPALIQLDSQRRFELGDRTTIGRGQENSVALDDPMVSSVHAEIVRGADGSFHVRDLNSRRGTFVGARKVSESVLRDGDEILIGPVRLQFEAAKSVGSPTNESEELRKLRAVVELSRAIGVEHDLDRLLERVLETCFQLLRADRGMILVYEPGSKTPSATVARTRSGALVEDALSTSVLSQIMATREPYLRTEIDSDLTLRRSESLSAQGVRSLVAVPLLYQDTEWVGVIHLDSRAVKNVFVQRDLDLLCAIAGQAALAIKNAMLVRQVQSVQSEDWRRLERVVASLPVGVVVIDDQRRCVLVNEWVTKRVASIGTVKPGRVIDQLAGLACDRLVGGDLREQVTLGSPESTFVVNTYASRDGRETVIVISDITEQLAQQSKAAHQDRLALIGQLAGGIAHDFNNLLFIIVNYAGILRETVVEPESLEDVRMIGQAADSASALVRQLLAFSRRETVKPKVIDVATVVTAMEGMLKRTVGERVSLTIEVASGPQRVLIDPSQLEQIVMNLVVNARDAMEGKGRLSIRIDEAADCATLEVTDTGSGMTQEVAARVFEPYFTTKAAGKGTGLGLATVHGIVEHGGGHISVSSEPGRGTTFKISLPRTTLSPEECNLAVGGPGRGRILLVDDDDQVRRLTERMLRRAGYDVVSAACAPDALSEVRQAPFDVLLTDMVMPGMSGRDLAREVAQHSPLTRVIFMSGYNPGTPIPPWQFIAKPFDRETLLTKMGDLQASAARVVR